MSLATVKSLKADILSLVLRQSDWRRADARNVSRYTFYRDQFTFSTQLVTLNYLLFVTLCSFITTSIFVRSHSQSPSNSVPTPPLTRH